MIGYKGTEKMKCQNITYEVGKTYIFNGELRIWKREFCFCKDIVNVDKSYQFKSKNTLILKIKIPDNAIIIDNGDESVTNKFKVLGVLNKKEIEQASNGRIKYDDNGNLVYIEDASGFWRKYEYDNNGNEIYYKDCNGFWWQYRYDENGNEIYNRDSYGNWAEKQYDNKGNLIGYINSNGIKWDIEII